MSIISYAVRENDSLQRIADKYGVSTESIIEYNNLQWPYISSSGPNLAVPSSGQVTLSFESAISEGFTLGSTFIVGSSLKGQSILREYTPVQDVQVGVGSLSVSFVVVCTVAGSFGNCAANQITEIVTPSLVPLGTSVTNLAGFTNGTNQTVLGPGSTLYIPSGTLSPGEQTGTISTPGILGGIDLAFNFILGDLIVGPGGDYEVVSGTNNISTNFIGHLMTNYGDLIHHTSYGTDAMEVVTGNNDNKDKLLALSITEALLSEPDVQSVGSVDFVQSGTSILANVSVVLSTGDVLPVSIPIG